MVRGNVEKYGMEIRVPDLSDARSTSINIILAHSINKTGAIDNLKKFHLAFNINDELLSLTCFIFVLTIIYM